MRDKENLTKLWALYEAAVQDPPRTVDVVDDVYRRIFRTAPLTLREDFCGTFAVGREWIKRGSKRRALGLDLSKPVARAAVRYNRELLSSEEQRRAAIRCSDVRTVTRGKTDVILAENFSYFVFKKRTELLEYFKACYRSLGKNGLVALDFIGGPEFLLTPFVERQTRRISPPQPGLPKKFAYTWNQLRYDPATAFGLYSIGFEFDGKTIPNAFLYDWRVWTLPEIRECFHDAGFDEMKIFWDDYDEPKEKLPEVRTIKNTPDAWLCLLVGIKRT